MYFFKVILEILGILLSSAILKIFLNNFEDQPLVIKNYIGLKKGEL